MNIVYGFVSIIVIVVAVTLAAATAENFAQAAERIGGIAMLAIAALLLWMVFS